MFKTISEMWRAATYSNNAIDLNRLGYVVCPSHHNTWTVTETTYTRPYIYYSPARPGKRWKK